jgi:DHA1 family tetracycline resistance protein-like MFS transporter
MSSPARGRPRAAVAFILVTALLDIMSLGIVIPVLAPLIEQLAGSKQYAGLWNGLFVALWAAMQFLCSPVIGSLSDRFGRRPVILLSVGGLALDFVLMAVAPDLWWLALGRMIGGITASNFTTTYAYMADITPPEERAARYGLIGAAFSAGFVAGPLIGGAMGEISPRAPFWAAAGLTGIAFLYGLFVLPESLAPEKRMAFSWSRANPLGALRLLRSHPDLTSLAGVNFLLYFSHHVSSAVFVLYAGDRYGWSAWQVGVLLAMVGALDMLVQGLLVGQVTKRIGDRRTMILGLAAGAVGLACMGLAPTGWLFVAAMFPNGLWGLAMPTIQSLMSQRVSESEQGQLQGANNSVGSIAGVASPLFFGAVYSASVGDGALFPTLGMPFLIAALVLGAGALLGAREQGAGGSASPA